MTTPNDSEKSLHTKVKSQTIHSIYYSQSQKLFDLKSREQTVCTKVGPEGKIVYSRQNSNTKSPQILAHKNRIGEPSPEDFIPSVHNTTNEKPNK